MYEDLSKPTTYQKEIKLYSGTSNPKLAQDIADILHLKLQGLKIEKFANGEIYARFEESVRGDEVFFIQTIAGKNVNDLIMETLIVADAATRASFLSMIEQESQVLQCFRVTGSYNFIIKVSCTDIDALEHLLTKMQKMGSTNTQIILNTQLDRNLTLEE